MQMKREKNILIFFKLRDECNKSEPEDDTAENPRMFEVNFLNLLLNLSIDKVPIQKWLNSINNLLTSHKYKTTLLPGKLEGNQMKPQNRTAKFNFNTQINKRKNKIVLCVYVCARAVV